MNRKSKPVKNIFDEEGLKKRGINEDVMKSAMILGTSGWLFDPKNLWNKPGTEWTGLDLMQALNLELKKRLTKDIYPL
jgi:hypothetical protein